MLALTPEMMDPRGLSPRGTAARVQLGTENHTEADTRHGKSASGSPVTAHRTLHVAWGCASHGH